MNRSEDVLAQQSRSNELAAIYEAHKEMVFRVSLGLSANRADAEDITQETFVQIHKSLKGFKHQSSLGTWIYRITIRVASRWLAKNRRDNRGESVHEPVADSPVGTRVDLIKALRKLPFNARLVVSLVMIQGLSHTEAAEVLNIPVGTVASRLHSAKKLLITYLS